MAKREDESFYKKYNVRWVLLITLWTFLISMALSVFAEGLIKNLDVVLGFVILIFFIFIGIVFDIIGISVTTADEKPFHAMAANKIEDARIAIKMVRNSSQVSSFCNDVIGDISGIISGAVASGIVFRLMTKFGLLNGTLITILLTAVTASITVGGKGLGKSVATYHYEEVIYSVSRVIGVFERLTGIEFMPDKRKNGNDKIRKNKEKDRNG
ncbi:MAG: hypothetical protein RBT15_09030 [Gudongella sp.]|nr:hypothetical protein [Gudongella sp.]